MAVSDAVISNDVLPAGSRLQEGNFVIENLLAAGSFGITYLARDHILNRPVVIKEYFPAGCQRIDEKIIPQNNHDSENIVAFATARERFLEEARVLAQFRHPGIVGVYNFFEANNTAYMVMEYLQGQTLLEVLEARGKLPPDEVFHIARELCAALEVVHEAGMLHRDIKPGNVIWCDDGRVVLVDFGLSERFDSGNSHATRPLDTALRFGTPGYAPLEQYTHSAQLGPPSDIYALGATLYHLCCGQTPLPATDRACGVELPSPQCAHPILSECILWAMSLQITTRPVSVGGFLERLNEADAALSARLQLVRILQRRGEQKAARDRVAARRLAQQETAPAADDAGCMKVAFILYLSVWGFAAAVWFIFLFVRFVLVGG
jgi:serine/threonine-protein kinase